MGELLVIERGQVRNAMNDKRDGYILFRIAVESWFEMEGENVWVRRLLCVGWFVVRDMHHVW